MRPRLDPHGDVVALAAALVAIPSVSGAEDEISTAVHEALARAGDHLQVTRHGNVVLARTDLGRAERVVLAAHLDTVPAAHLDTVPAAHLDTVPAGDNAGARRVDGPDGPELAGLGSVDMKGGLAVALHLIATLTAPGRDLTAVFYDCEEVEASRNGLGHLVATDPTALAGDLAILLEPTGGVLEGGCQGSLQVRVDTAGARAHTARAWTGSNAIHALVPVLERLRSYVPARPVVDGLQFREGLQAVGIDGGVAGNVVPDRAAVRVNFRYAPDRTSAAAIAHVREVFSGYEVTVLDDAGPARPGLDRPAVAALAAAIGRPARAKYGWTDVARFAGLGIPAVNFGPGDPSRAHTPGESVPEAQIHDVARALGQFLSNELVRSDGGPGVGSPVDAGERSPCEHRFGTTVEPPTDRRREQDA